MFKKIKDTIYNILSTTLRFHRTYFKFIKEESQKNNLSLFNKSLIIFPLYIFKLFKNVSKTIGHLFSYHLLFRNKFIQTLIKPSTKIVGPLAQLSDVIENIFILSYKISFFFGVPLLITTILGYIDYNSRIANDENKTGSFFKSFINGITSLSIQFITYGVLCSSAIILSNIGIPVITAYVGSLFLSHAIFAPIEIKLETITENVVDYCLDHTANNQKFVDSYNNLKSSLVRE